jgi:hypothetical protein
MSLLTDRQKEDFHRDGFLKIPNFYERDALIEPIQLTLRAMIKQVAIRHKQLTSELEATDQEFDAGYLNLILKDRRFGSEIYDLAKQVPGLHKLIGDPRHSRIFEDLRPTSTPAVAHGGFGIRIDNPFEDTFRAQWHQEYPAQLRSPNGLVFWTPLVPVTNDIGPVQIAIGSHREGPLPVSKKSYGERVGAYALDLDNEDHILGKYERTAPLLGPGDLLIMDFMLLHASGYNRGNRSRWTIQFRYFDVSNPTGRTNGWVGSFAEGVDFAKLHPELLVANDENS